MNKPSSAKSICSQCGESNRPQRFRSPLVRESRHEVSHFHDPFAKRSRKVDRQAQKRKISGDGDVWVEKICQNKKTGKFVRFFMSTKTGASVKNEPPTGASKVVYLKEEYLKKTLYIAGSSE